VPLKSLITGSGHYCICNCTGAINYHTWMISSNTLIWLRTKVSCIYSFKLSHMTHRIVEQWYTDGDCILLILWMVIRTGACCGPTFRGSCHGNCHCVGDTDVNVNVTTCLWNTTDTNLLRSSHRFRTLIWQINRHRKSGTAYVVFI